MKIKNLIKADFFLNPKNYGFYTPNLITENTIWNRAIKPNIIEIDYSKKIENSDILLWIGYYRAGLQPYVRDYCELLLIENYSYLLDENDS